MVLSLRFCFKSKCLEVVIATMPTTNFSFVVSCVRSCFQAKCLEEVRATLPTTTTTISFVILLFDLLLSNVAWYCFKSYSVLLCSCSTAQVCKVHSAVWQLLDYQVGQLVIALTKLTSSAKDCQVGQLVIALTKLCYPFLHRDGYESCMGTMGTA